MVEAGAKQVSEKDMLEAILLGHEAIKGLCDFQVEIQKAVGVEKIVPELVKIDPKVEADVKAYAEKNLIEAVSIVDKLERYAAIDRIKEETLEHFGKSISGKKLMVLKYRY